jgi:hypothetical protein
VILLSTNGSSTPRGPTERVLRRDFGIFMDAWRELESDKGREKTQQNQQSV